MGDVRTLWGIHGGATGDADQLFLEEGYVALGWRAIGDLQKMPADREAFKQAVASAYPEKKPGAIPNNAGQLFRFVHETKVGDFVAYPSKVDRCIHLGQIEGSYEYAPARETGYPHQRPVKWLKTIPRPAFSQGALYEIGSAMSFFQIKVYADEFLAKLEQGKHEEPSLEVGEDATVTVVAEEVQENTNDFVLNRLSKELKGHPFAHFVAHLLNQMGYRTRVSPPGADGGVDIRAHKDELGFEPPIIKAQVKSSTDKVDDATVKSLYGNVDAGEFGLFVSLGSFTSPARLFERTRSNLRLIDGIQLVELMLEHYEGLDAKYKAIIPLKRVYVPQPTDEDE